MGDFTAFLRTLGVKGWLVLLAILVAVGLFVVTVLLSLAMLVILIVAVVYELLAAFGLASLVARAA